MKRLKEAVEDTSGTLPRGGGRLKELLEKLELRSKERSDRIFKLINDFIGTGDRDKVSFLERILGWMSEVRKAFKEGTGQRTRIVDKIIELADYSKSKLEGTQMLRVSGILENLLETRGGKDAYSLFAEYFYGHLLDYAGLRGERVESSLLEECLIKWEVASRIKDSHVSLLRQDVSGGSIRYQANTPEEVNFIRVDKDGEEAYIPIISARIPGKKSYIVEVPGDAQKYLKRIGYLPGDTGLILFTESIPKGARVIIPVVTREEGKIALTEWLERFLHKNTEYRKRYLIDTGRGYVLNWKQLDEDHVVLMATIRKFGTEFEKESALEPGEYSKRTILLKPHTQNIIRTRVSDIAGADEIVLCKFKLELRNMLSLEEAEDIFLNQYGVRKEAAKKLARRLSRVMLYTDEEGKRLP